MPFRADRPDGGAVHIARLDDEPIEMAPRLLGLTTGRAVLVVVGGAAGMDEQAAALTRETVRHVVLPVVADTRAVVVDGGTDSGVMRAMGAAAAASDWPGPLVGVAVAGLVTDPGTPPGEGQAGLEPHHTHALLVPGREWGDESAALARLATALAAGQPTATLLVNGGEIGRADVANSRAENRPLLVLRGSGRLADELADADPCVTVLDPTRPAGEQRNLLLAVLSRQPG